MFGIRTPCKPRVAEHDSQNTMSESGLKEPGPLNPTSGVRKSIGEWEVGKPENRKSLTPPKSTVAVGPSKAKAATVRRLSTEEVGSPPRFVNIKYADRLSEAKACVTKAKLNLSRSGNLKREIKTEVHLAIDRLYQLVKEADCVKASTGRQPKEVEKSENRIEIGELEKTIEKHSELIRENNEKMEHLRTTLERQSYASVAATTARMPHPEKTALHSVVITAKDETETGEEVLGRIREAVKAKEGGIQVERIRKAKDRKVIVGCRTEEERRKIKERLSKATELNVEDIKNKDPLVILKDILQYNSDEDVMISLRNQNKLLYKDIRTEDDRAQIVYKKRTRNPHTCHIVMRVSPILWQRMIQAEAVHIDLQRVRVADQSPLVQCSLCLGYGHGRRFCKEALEKCSHCGGPHVKARCADWLAGGIPSCTNCTHAKLDKTDHNAFSMDCSIRRKWDSLARANVAYC